MDEPRTMDRADRVRSVGSTVGDTVEALGRAESRFVQTLGELVGESTRAVGAAAARTADDMREGAGPWIDVAGDATARAVEATGRFTGVILDAGGAYVRELADVATEAAAATLERREHDDSGDDEATVVRIDGPM
jgi:hypothetical protein